MKKQTRNTKVKTNEEEIGKLPEKEFRIMIVKVKNLNNKMEKIQESINKDLEELKNKHTETNSTITDLGSSSFSVLSFCLFILYMGLSRQEY